MVTKNNTSVSYWVHFITLAAFVLIVYYNVATDEVTYESEAEAAGAHLVSSFLPALILFALAYWTKGIAVRNGRSANVGYLIGFIFAFPGLVIYWVYVKLSKIK